jgi:predicted metal-dependent hydrolase
MPLEFEYTIKESARATKMRISVFPTGEVVVVKPRRISIIQVKVFVLSKRVWIVDRIEDMKNKKPSLMPPPSQYDFLLHKSAARDIAIQKLDQWNEFYQFSFSRVEIKNMKTRWGSCSSRKTLCFNYRIVFLSEELQDYLVVHELCHLAEMNHSARFWKQVERAIPNYRILRKAINTDT